MKSKANLLTQLEKLPYFTKDTFLQIGQKYDLTQATLDTYISRFLKFKDVIKLKNGFYVTKTFFEKNRLHNSYIFYLANILREQSYISTWSALQYYDLVTEVIHTITSVSTKITRTYKNKAGNFVYNSINKELSSDFLLVKGEFPFFIAKPSKALFDLLYFKTNQFNGVKIIEIPNLIKELRIDFGEIKKGERENFKKLIHKQYNI